MCVLTSRRRPTPPRVLYNDYCLLFGYGHNWVLSPKWLVNFTITPYIGYRYNHFPNADDRATNISLNCRARTAAVYNHKQFFLGFQAMPTTTVTSPGTAVWSIRCSNSPS